MKNKTPKNNTLKWNVLRKRTLKNDFKNIDLQAYKNYNSGNWKQELKTENVSSINQWWEIQNQHNGLT